MGGQARATWWLCVGVLGAGCNVLAGIDGDFVRADDTVAGSGSVDSGFNGASGAGGASGSFGTGGTEGEGFGGTDGASANGGSGGVDPSGGASGLDGSGGSSGTDTVGGAGGTGPTCGATQKRCGDSCVDPNPNLGCSLTDCNPCPDPPTANSEIICGDNQCVAQCKSGFVPLGGQCVPENSVDGGGGATGAGGSAGTAGRGGSGGSRQCVVEQCPSCSLFVGFACCTFFRTCGCSFAGRVYCI